MTRGKIDWNGGSACFQPASSRIFDIFPAAGDGALQEVEAGRLRHRLRGVDSDTVLVVTGLAAEARLAAGTDIHVVTSGGQSENLAGALDAAIRAKVSAIVSFGIAGGLAPGIRPGTLLVARGIVAEDAQYYECDRVWSQRLAKALGDVPIVDMAGADRPVADPAGKRALHVATRAATVDTESHVAARAAAAHGLPFAAFRVVADPAERKLPPAALVGVRPDGRLAMGRIMCSLISEPRQIPHLFRTALDTRAALDGLFRGREMIAGSFGFLDFSELMLDVPREDVIGGSLPV